jgi:hypothetical protein
MSALEEMLEMACANIEEAKGKPSLPAMILLGDIKKQFKSGEKFSVPRKSANYSSVVELVDAGKLKRDGFSFWYRK